ncbi:hypothetical protein FEM48_Zijuj12G0011700 [Ziziphus jujuba var. spinosa]|uniref:Protein FAR1-RELATED SEQUENCE n=1 Tax=Ziziphus jujuba var. spinosa TaxID=714518 RepID=A0A978UAB8_ZIZJJ|nr:hypothetical protein FEM48_Zijuj12G0011700 [Ziziphus jujuba var. spinosa]
MIILIRWLGNRISKAKQAASFGLLFSAVDCGGKHQALSIVMDLPIDALPAYMYDIASASALSLPFPRTPPITNSNCILPFDSPSPPLTLLSPATPFLMTIAVGISLTIILSTSSYLKDQAPEYGMEFSSEEEAYEFYKNYAQQNGFYINQQQQPKYKRKSTRTGCKANVQLTLQAAKWIISDLLLDHNHDIDRSTTQSSVKHSHHQPPSTMHKQPVANDISAAKYTRLHGHDHTDSNNYLHHRNMNILQPEDVQGLIDYFKHLKVEDSSFFYTIRVDAENGSSGGMAGHGLTMIILGTMQPEMEEVTSFGMVPVFKLIEDGHKKDEVVTFDCLDEMAGKSNRPSSRNLMHKALHLVTKSAATEESRKITEYCQDVTLKKVEYVLKTKGVEHMNTTSSEVDC